jgi:hypothetical protein
MNLPFFWSASLSLLLVSSLSNVHAIPSRRPWYIRVERSSSLLSGPLRSPFDSMGLLAQELRWATYGFAGRSFQMQNQSSISLQLLADGFQTDWHISKVAICCHNECPRHARWMGGDRAPALRFLARCCNSVNRSLPVVREAQLASLYRRGGSDPPCVARDQRKPG